MNFRENANESLEAQAEVNGVQLEPLLRQVSVRANDIGLWRESARAC